MQAWLKLIGSSDKPITEHPFYGTYQHDFIGFRKSNRPGIRKGDHVFLYAPGGSRRIFAFAEAAGDPEPDPGYDPREAGSCRWRIRVRYIINLPVDSGIFIEDANVGSRDLAQSVCRQSHIRLSSEEYDLANRKLRKKGKVEQG
jgi:hypothetical protein